MSEQPTPECFFCGSTVSWKEGRLTDHGRVYGQCCADLVGVREQIIAERRGA